MTHRRPIASGSGHDRATKIPQTEVSVAIRNEQRKSKRSAEEASRLRADRERYQRERPTPEQLLAEGGHADFVPLGERWSCTRPSLG
jgi:predicted phage gp36 major capsid-like protein